MKLLNSVKRRFAKYAKPKFRSTYSENPNPNNILDIGIGNDSYNECKMVFPDAKYFGLDYEEINFKMQDGDVFIFENLEEDHALENQASIYDLIIINHVLEHLMKGDFVFEKLIKLMRKNALLYAEFPSIRSAYQKKSGASYHFHDDPTHKKFYVMEDMANIAIKHGCQIISCGPVNAPPLKSILSLPRAILNFVSGKGFLRFLPSATRLNDHIFIKKITDNTLHKC